MGLKFCYFQRNLRDESGSLFHRVLTQWSNRPPSRSHGWRRNYSGRCVGGIGFLVYICGLTGYGSPIRIQCGLVGAPNGTQTTRIELLDGSHALSWSTQSRSTAHSSDPDRGNVEAKWSLDLDPRSAPVPDPRFRFGEPHCILQ